MAHLAVKTETAESSRLWVMGAMTDRRGPPMTWIWKARYNGPRGANRCFNPRTCCDPCEHLDQHASSGALPRDGEMEQVCCKNVARCVIYTHGFMRLMVGIHKNGYGKTAAQKRDEARDQLTRRHGLLEENCSWFQFRHPASVQLDIPSCVRMAVSRAFPTHGSSPSSASLGVEQPLPSTE